MNDADTMWIEFSVREATALQSMGEIMAGAFEEAGCDLTDVELPDGSRGVAPLVSGCMRLEVALVAAGAVD